MSQQPQDSSIPKLPSHVKKLGGSCVPFAKTLGWKRGEYLGDVLHRYCRENKVHETIHLAKRTNPLPNRNVPAFKMAQSKIVQTVAKGTPVEPSEFVKNTLREFYAKYEADIKEHGHQPHFCDQDCVETEVKKEEDDFDSNTREIVLTENYIHEFDNAHPIDTEPVDQATAPLDMGSIVDVTKSMTLATNAIPEPSAEPVEPVDPIDPMEFEAEPIVDDSVGRKTLVNKSVQVGDGLEETVALEVDAQPKVNAPAKRKWRLNKRVQAGNGLIVQAHLEPYPKFPDNIFVPIPIVYFYRYQGPEVEEKPIEGPLYFRDYYAQMFPNGLQNGNRQLVDNAQGEHNVDQSNNAQQGVKRPSDDRDSD